MRKKIYFIVTNDEYEFPIKEVCGIKEALPYFNVKENTLRRMLFEGRWGKHEYKLVDSGVEADYESKAEYSRRYYAEHDRSKYYHERWIKNNPGKSRASKYGKYIQKKSNGYEVWIKGRYLAVFKTHEQAIEYRDEYLKSHNYKLT